MRPTFPAALLVALFPACGGAAATAPNPADKPGGATNMQPGSGGTYEDVVRSDGTQPAPAGNTAQPTGDAVAEPKKEPPPLPEPAPPKQ